MEVLEEARRHGLVSVGAIRELLPSGEVLVCQHALSVGFRIELPRSVHDGAFVLPAVRGNDLAVAHLLDRLLVDLCRLFLGH